MKEHNKNFYSLEEVERCLEVSKDFQDGEEIYYFIGALRYVYDENKRLNNIINELEKMMKNDLECACLMNENGLFNGAIDILEVYLDKLQELKGSGSNE